VPVFVGVQHWKTCKSSKKSHVFR